MRLKDKVTVISAAASGMGKEGALLFAKEGAIVNVLDINEEAGQAVVDEIKSNGGEAYFYRVDLSDLNEIESVIKTIGDKFNRIDVLWNHAGIPGPKGVEDVEEDEFDFAMDLNVKSGFFMTKYALAYMKGGESIIFTASTSGLFGSPLSPVYSAAKGAVVNLVRGLAIRLGSRNIRVNSVCPGLTETPMMNQFLKRTEDDDVESNKRKFTDNIPLGRVGNPKDIAKAALFLASDDSEYISGVNLPVDGGFTA